MGEPKKATAAAGFLELEPEAPAEPVAVQEEKPKRRRKSIIDRERIPGGIPEAVEYKKRKRAKKPAELRKSHSMTVLITEETYQRFKRVTEQQELSMNGVIGRLIRKYIMLHDIDNDDLGV